MTTRRVAWRRSDEVQADEHCTITMRDGGLSLVGTVLGAEDGVPIRVEYRVLVDAAGETTAVHVRDLRGFAQRTLTLARDTKGSWTVDGVRRQGAQGLHRRRPRLQPVDEHAADPAAPPRRRAVEDDPGGVGPVPVARPSRRAAQTYTRLDEFTYRYASGTFEAELVVDDDGVVAQYAEWQRTAVATGPEDTEPLDGGR